MENKNSEANKLDKDLKELIKQYISSKDTTIYHYTSLQGLKSIIENSTLRFTECCYMNDKEEYNDVIKIMEELKKDNEGKNNEKYDILKCTLESIDKRFGDKNVIISRSEDNKYSFSSTRYFILSTTLLRDSLPMWRCYTKGSTIDGSVIALDVNSLKESLHKINFLNVVCGRVIYDDKLKYEFLNKAVDIIVDEYKKGKEIIESTYSQEDKRDEMEFLMDNATAELIRFVNQIRLFIKNNSFEYENEYRLLIVCDANIIKKSKTATGSHELDINFVPYEGLLRTHLDLNFNKSNTITGIFTSPNSDLFLLERAIRDMLSFNGYDSDKIKIEKSNCSIRF